ncbi:MAG: uroporphyrinogen-III synthase [Rhodobacteraceae bacterium]|nr:uroporphyrinogen-III synthase [Paracoccaceae bacterium]
MAVLLMTRPRAAAERFVQALSLDLAPIYAPLLDIRPLDQSLNLTGYAGVIFTSANGARQASDLTSDRTLPAYCVGAMTTQAARDAGWQANMRGRDASEMINSLLQSRPEGTLLHLRGEHARGDIAENLTQGGLPCKSRVIYDQVLKPLSQEALDALLSETDVIAPIFSPRSARQFAEFCPKAAKPHLVALSRAVSEPLRGLNYKSLSVCDEPDSGSMMAEVARVWENIRRVEGEPDAD